MSRLLSFAARVLQLLHDTLTQSDGITLAALRMLDDLPCNHLRKRVSPPLQAQSSEDVFIRCRESLHSVRVERSFGEHPVNRHRALLPRPEHRDFNSLRALSTTIVRYHSIAWPMSTIP